MGYKDRCDISVLLGKTLTRIDNDSNDEILFVVNGDEQYIMYHDQDCCEHVYIEDISGDLQDLIGSPILQAEAVVSSEPSPELAKERADKDAADRAAFVPRYEGHTYYSYSEDSETWTFYKLATVKGYVTIRWYGSSNGYYSESVDFERVKND